MHKYSLKIDEYAKKDIEKLKKHGQVILKGFSKKIEEVLSNPFKQKALKGFDENFYRARFNNCYRFIFFIDRQEHAIIITAVGHRKDIYNNFKRK